MKHPSNWFNSFLHAIHGICIGAQERNMRFHIVAGIAVCIVGYVLHLTQIEWGFILSAIMIVLVTELINTAIEYTCDFISTTYSFQIKKIKDLAAAAVLISALYAVSIGLLIFLPKML